MVATMTRTQTFYPRALSYNRTRLLGVGMCAVLLLCSALALLLGIHMWGTYTHVFKPYLKWQDALTYSLWFFSFLCLGGTALVARFLVAAAQGYRNGTYSIHEEKLVVCDTSHGNLGSIFWVLNAAFWCFIAVLVGLVPVILIGWTIHLSPLLLAIVATGLALLLSLAGLVVSAIGGSFICIGIVGLVPFSKKMGAPHVYKMDGKLTVRVDGHVLTAIYPDTPETMLDLNSFEPHEQHLLLTRLYEQWQRSNQLWMLEWDEQSVMVSVAESQKAHVAAPFV